eukprot:350933-Chlamydomonas_euryale.AAC.4
MFRAPLPSYALCGSAWGGWMVVDGWMDGRMHEDAEVQSILMNAQPGRGNGMGWTGHSCHQTAHFNTVGRPAGLLAGGGQASDTNAPEEP